MSFSREIREQALVAAARHCCVCHRYKGVKIEVHHIQPKAAGGDDSLENAISLCFDCHADAGHYNAMHPRGTRLSQTELRLQRDAWHTIVQTNHIELAGKDILYCRYLVCNDLYIAHELLKGDLSKCPAPNAFLWANNISTFQNDLIGNYPCASRNSVSWGEGFQSPESFFRKHPEAIGHGDAPDKLDYSATRAPTSEDLNRISDPLTKSLANSGVPLHELITVRAYWEMCSEKIFQEVYSLRSSWVVLLSIENISGEHVRLATLEATSAIDPKYRTADTSNTSIEARNELPHIQISPNQTILIPVATVLPPFTAKPESSFIHNSISLGAGGTQTLIHEQYDMNACRHFNLIGPNINPTSVRVEIKGNLLRQNIHQLDFKNIYLINRSWACGTCPHMFFANSLKNTITYAGELFTKAPNQNTITTLEVPQTTDFLIIAELEDEDTHITDLTADGISVINNIVLCKNQYLALPVSSGQVLKISGYYSLLSGVTYKKGNYFQRRLLIDNFLGSLQERGNLSLPRHKEPVSI